jgi:hypothetical protein
MFEKWHTSAEVKKMWIYTSTPIRLHRVVLNWLSTGTTLPYTHKKVNIFSCSYVSVIFVQHTFVAGLYDEVILFVRAVEDILLKFHVRMRLQLMAFGDPKNQQATAVPDM